MENVTLEKLQFDQLLPVWMRLDKYDESLSECLSNETVKIADKIYKLNLWTSIDDMTEAQLDEMAWEWNIAWYQYDANIAMKRAIVKNARKIHRHLGTKWAIDEVLSIYFNTSKVLQWYEYNGTPGHFKIQTVNSATVNEQAEKFLKILDIVKRKSQWLDAIEVISDSDMTLEYVIVPRRIDVDRSIIRE